MVNIRTLEKKDSQQVGLLINQLSKHIIEPEMLNNRIEKMVKGNNYQYFVAEDNDKILGFAGLAYYDIPSKGLIGWIEEVVVDEAARGHGVGRLLMEKLISFGKEKGCTRLKLTTGNPIARKLYESLGFEKSDQDYFSKSL